MENATKALLIAAAILVAILIISLGLVVYNMAAETVQGVNMSDQEVKAFNDKFTRYEGTNKKGANINALMNEVLQNNLNNVDDPNKVITLQVTSNNPAGTITVDGTTTAGQGKVPTGNVYTVVVNYDANTKLINNITATQTN